jgi:hypothetical protein
MAEETNVVHLPVSELQLLRADLVEHLKQVRPELSRAADPTAAQRSRGAYGRTQLPRRRAGKLGELGAKRTVSDGGCSRRPEWNSLGPDARMAKPPFQIKRLRTAQRAHQKSCFHWASERRLRMGFCMGLAWLGNARQPSISSSFRHSHNRPYDNAFTPACPSIRDTLFAGAAR